MNIFGLISIDGQVIKSKIVLRTHFRTSKNDSGFIFLFLSESVINSNGYLYAAVAINGYTAINLYIVHCTRVPYLSNAYYIEALICEYVETREKKKLIRIVINFLIGFGCYPNKIKQTNSNKISTRVAQQHSTQRERNALSVFFLVFLGTHRWWIPDLIRPALVSSTYHIVLCIYVSLELKF